MMEQYAQWILPVITFLAGVAIGWLFRQSQEDD